MLLFQLLQTIDENTIKIIDDETGNCLYNRYIEKYEIGTLSAIEDWEVVLIYANKMGDIVAQVREI